MKKKPVISPGKEPKQGRSKSMVETVLTATTRILLKTGYDHATTNRIAEMAGISIGSLYQYFPSKESIIAALIDQKIERSRLKIEGKLAEFAAQRAKGKSVPLEDVISSVVHVAAEMYLGNRAVMKVLFEQTPQVERTQHIFRARAHVADILRELLSTYDDQIRSKDLELTLYVLVHAVIGVLTTAMYEMPKGVDEAALTKELVRLSRRYLIA